MTSDTKIAIASDHGGFVLKAELLQWLKSQGYDVLDLGADSEESSDYPDFGAKMAQAIIGGQVNKGVLICGTGIGISIAANRFSEVRCAVCHDVTTSYLARAHNDANVLAVGARTTGPETVKDILKTFLETDFDAKDRYVRRKEKLGAL